MYDAYGSIACAEHILLTGHAGEYQSTVPSAVLMISLES